MTTSASTRPPLSRGLRLALPLAALALAVAPLACDESGGSAGVSDGGAGAGGTGPAGGAGVAGNTGGPGAGDAGSAGAPGSGGGTGDAGVRFPPTPDFCPVRPAQCSNGLDDDNDGLTDAEDPECTGPCDNRESSFATGIPGDNMDDLASCRQDCFFDGDSGGDAEDCQWDLRCDPSRADSRQCRYSPMSPQVRCPTQQSATCLRVCRNLTPNGCDCFGCCLVPGTDFGVRLTDSCNAASVNDPQKCMRCTPAPSCINPCGPCEICFGKPMPEPGCADQPTQDGGAPPDGGMYGERCPSGYISCGPGGQVPTNGCPSPTYCITGCCVQNID